MVGASLVKGTIYVEVKSLSKMNPSQEELELLEPESVVDDFNLVKGIPFLFSSTHVYISGTYIEIPVSTLRDLANSATEAGYDMSGMALASKYSFRAFPLRMTVLTSSIPKKKDTAESILSF